MFDETDYDEKIGGWPRVNPEPIPMDWTYIRATYLLAYAQLVHEHETQEFWGHIDHPDGWDEWINEEHYVMRHLYDFFDRQGITLVLTYGRPGNDLALAKRYGWEIHYELRTVPIVVTHDFHHTSRQLAENQLFTTAFALLESNLTATTHEKESKEAGV